MKKLNPKGEQHVWNLQTENTNAYNNTSLCINLFKQAIDIQMVAGQRANATIFNEKGQVKVLKFDTNEEENHSIEQFKEIVQPLFDGNPLCESDKFIHFIKNLHGQTIGNFSYYVPSF